MYTDFVINGVGHGPVAEVIFNGEGRFDPGLLRPFIDPNDRKKYCTINTGRTEYDKEVGADVPVFEDVLVKDLIDAGIESPVFNSSMRKQEWVRVDDTVQREYLQRLRAWSDLAGANPVGGFNGMAFTTYEYEAMSEAGIAIESMDGLTEEMNDTPLWKLRSMPLPIQHSGFFYSQRQLMVSRNKGMPLSQTMPSMAARRIAELVEKKLIGSIAGLTFGTDTGGLSPHDGTSTQWGYTTFPYKIDFTGLTVPTGTNPDAIFDDVLAMRDELYDNNCYGPFIIYTSRDWDRYLDNVFYVAGTGMGTATGTTTTLRQMIKGIEGIQDIRRLDFFETAFSMIMVQMTSDVAQAINGMDITTVMWETQGGMRQNFKVMAINVPLLKADFEGRSGILYARP